MFVCTDPVVQSSFFGFGFDSYSREICLTAEVSPGKYRETNSRGPLSEGKRGDGHRDPPDIYTPKPWEVKHLCSVDVRPVVVVQPGCCPGWSSGMPAVMMGEQMNGVNQEDGDSLATVTFGRFCDFCDLDWQIK